MGDVPVSRQFKQELLNFICTLFLSLQMEDSKTGHGFLHQYNGPNVEHLVTGLQRNTTYRFTTQLNM